MPAILLALVFLALGAVHFYWAGGGRWAADVVIPRVEGRPVFAAGRWATVAVGVMLWLCAALIGARAGWFSVDLPGSVLTWLCYSLAAVLLLRAIGDFRFVGFFDRVQGSRFAELDTKLYSPLCLLLAAGVFAVARG